MSGQARSNSVALEHGSLLRRRSTRPDNVAPSKFSKPSHYTSGRSHFRPNLWLIRVLYASLVVFIAVFIIQRFFKDTSNRLRKSTSYNSTLDVILDPVVHRSDAFEWQDHWEASYNRVLRCLVDGYEPEAGYKHLNASHHPKLVKCRENRTKVALLTCIHFQHEKNGLMGGEQVWAKSIHNALDAAGYSSIIALDKETVLEIYRRIRSLIKVIIPCDEFLQWKDDTSFIQSDSNPRGIPMHKMLDFVIWPIERHPYGWPFTLQMHRYPNAPNSFYIGYSLESCKNNTMIPHNKRRHSIWVLGKMELYYSDVVKSYEEHHSSWGYSTYKKIRDRFGIDLRAAITPTENSKHIVPEGINNLVKHGDLLSPDEFEHEVASSKLMLGVGAPLTSPSPYQALCVGVPFINPIFTWKEDDPDNPEFWNLQHVPLGKVKPPYVYNIKHDDEEGLLKAVDAALNTPIDRWFDEDFSNAAVQSRIETMMERDWEGLANEIKAAKGIS